ncbi:MAG: 1,4-alpha-glucan branching protein GlgB [Saccharofermentanales bacterium]|jgi:1,4-alpha-glucan branching enzyme
MTEAWRFNEGKHHASYRFLGARPDLSPEGEQGYRFAVWAPRAAAVSAVGDFNGWDRSRDRLSPYGTTGIWQGFVPGAVEWQRYRYAIETRDGRVLMKADPYARHAETRPNSASILYDFENDYTWGDADFMATRRDALAARPLNIYEVHLGSWRRYADGNPYNYRDLAPQLARYCVEMGYTAVELMPVMEHPLDASWGYQVTGYYAPTSRYGTPADFKCLVDTLHRAGLLVILDWVPAHFPRDDFALARFDGEPLYEYADPNRGEHPSWGTLVFDYGRPEVRSFLMSNAVYWLEEFHADGLRYDAVSSMIYLDFGREHAVPNPDGSFEHREAIDFMKSTNRWIREHYPHAILAAEESTPYPDITVPVEHGGLGFTHKWNMGWMNDTLSYMEHDYYARGDVHDKITFSMVYAFRERFILPFSHDEVVHGKKTLLGRMPGDPWRKFASLRTCYMYQMSHPGAKLNFMGNEYAPYLEWRYYEELEWFMLMYPSHDAMRTFVKTLNGFYKDCSAMWSVDTSWDGFQWLDVNDREHSTFAYARFGRGRDEVVVVLLNMTPQSYAAHTIRVPRPGRYRVAVNSDAPCYGGSGFGPLKETAVITTAPASDATADEYRLTLPLPPLAGVYLVYEGVGDDHHR